MLLKFTERSLKIAIYAVGLYALTAYFYTGCLKLVYPYAVNLGESSLVQSILLLAKGMNPYRDLSAAPPFALMPYGPVFPILSLPGYFLGAPPFLSPRIVCFAAGFMAAGLLWDIARRHGVRESIALTAPILFVSHLYLFRWGVQANVDLTGVCFALAAFACLDRFRCANYEKYTYLAAGIVLNALAFYTKSSMAACGTAFFICLVAERRWRLAWVYAAAQGTLLAAVYAALNGMTHGGYFFHTTYEISKRYFFGELIIRLWSEAFRDGPLLAVSTVCLLIFGWREKRLRFFVIYLVIILGLSFSLGKQGSDSNYFLEWIAAASVATAILYRIVSGGRARLSVFFLALIFLEAVWQIYPNAAFWELKNDLREKKVFFDRISQAFINPLKGNLLTEDPGLLIANGYPIIYEPFPMGQMTYSGAWDNASILRALEKKEFAMAILFFHAARLVANRTFPPSFMTAFKANYRYLGRLTPPAQRTKNPVSYYLYVPNT